VLRDWARKPLQDTERLLITPTRRMVYSGMLPGWIEGLYRREELEIDLLPLAAAAGVRVVSGEVAGLDPDRRQLRLADGTTLHYDLLSLAVGGELDLTSFTGTEALLPIRPIEAFFEAWRALEQAQAARIAVVGGGAAGTELALAIATKLCRGRGRARVTLIAGAAGLMEGHPPSVRRRSRAALAQRGVEIFETDATTGPHGLELTGVGALQSDAVVVATGRTPPGWLAMTGLMLGPGGGVAIGADMRSLSHPSVWAAGDVSERPDRPLARSGVHAVKSGPILAANLRSAVEGGAIRRYDPPSRTLYLLSTGGRRAILSWGGLAMEGAWVWRLKNWIDRRFVTRYQHWGVTGGVGRANQSDCEIGDS